VTVVRDLLQMFAAAACKTLRLYYVFSRLVTWLSFGTWWQ